VSPFSGTGKTKRVLVFCNLIKNEAKRCRSESCWITEYVEENEKGWMDVDVIIATSVMPKIAKLGRFSVA
jgi:ribosomal protein L1